MVSFALGNIHPCCCQCHTTQVLRIEPSTSCRVWFVVGPCMCLHALQQQYCYRPACEGGVTAWYACGACCMHTGRRCLASIS